MTDFEQRLAALMEDAKRELIQIGIYPSKNILGIKENRRAKKRLGCCRLERNGFRKSFWIEIATVLRDADDKALKQVILHELLHTCPGCFNHGTEWKRLADQVNQVYGCQIQRVSRSAELGVAEEKEVKYKYRIRCEKCGCTSYRMKKSRVVQTPKKYRCGKCGGALKVDQI